MILDITFAASAKITVPENTGPFGQPVADFRSIVNDHPILHKVDNQLIQTRCD